MTVSNKSLYRSWDKHPEVTILKDSVKITVDTTTASSAILCPGPRSSSLKGECFLHRRASVGLLRLPLTQHTLTISTVCQDPFVKTRLTRECLQSLLDTSLSTHQSSPQKGHNELLPLCSCNASPYYNPICIIVAWAPPF